MLIFSSLIWLLVHVFLAAVYISSSSFFSILISSPNEYQSSVKFSQITTFWIKHIWKMLKYCKVKYIYYLLIKSSHLIFVLLHLINIIQSELVALWLLKLAQWYWHYAPTAHLFQTIFFLFFFLDGNGQFGSSIHKY